MEQLPSEMIFEISKFLNPLDIKNLLLCYDLYNDKLVGQIISYHYFDNIVESVYKICPKDLLFDFLDYIDHPYKTNVERFPGVDFPFKEMNDMILFTSSFIITMKKISNNLLGECIKSNNYMEILEILQVILRNDLILNKLFWSHLDYKKLNPQDEFVESVEYIKGWLLRLAYPSTILYHSSTY